MRVTYTVTAEDMIPLLVRAARDAPGTRRRYYIVWFGVPLTCWTVSAVFLLVIADVMGAWAFLIAVLGASYAMAHPFLYWQYFEENLRANLKRELKRGGPAGTVLPTILTLTDRVMVVDSPYAGRAEVRLADLMPVKAGKDRTTVRLMTGIVVLVLPRRGCESDETYENARDFLVSRTEHNMPS